MNDKRGVKKKKRKPEKKEIEKVESTQNNRRDDFDPKHWRGGITLNGSLWPNP